MLKNIKCGGVAAIYKLREQRDISLVTSGAGCGEFILVTSGIYTITDVSTNVG